MAAFAEGATFDSHQPLQHPISQITWQFFLSYQYGWGGADDNVFFFHAKRYL
jgi:hypothetical protein